MTKKFLARGFWGPRAEGVGELADRIRSFLGRLEHIRPGGLEGWELPDGSRLVADDPAWMAGYIDDLVERFRKEASPEVGVTLVVSGTFSDGAKLEVAVSAGATTRVFGLQNSVVVDLFPPTSADDAVQQMADAGRALVALAEEWDPDWGDVATHELWQALRGRLETRKRAPRVGYLLYLSSARWQAINGMSIPAHHELLPGRGVLLSLISQTGSMPSPDQVAALDQALSDTGALGVTPVDAPHLV